MSNNKLDGISLDEARKKYVAVWEKKQVLLKRKNERQLTIAQTATLNFLKYSRFDGIIRQIIYPLSNKFTATKIVKGLIPLDGEFLDGHSPAFVIDDRGLMRSGTKLNVPGLKYSFYFDLDKVEITVSLCRNQSGHVYPVFTLSHTNGLNHLIDWKAYLENPDDDLLKEWLSAQIQKIITGKDLTIPEPIYLAN